MSPLKRARYAVEGAGLRASAWLVAQLPRSMMLGLADVSASVVRLLMRENKRVAMANLDIVFGDTKTPEEKEQIFRASVRNLCRTLVSLLWVPNLNEKNYDQYILVDPAEEQSVRAQIGEGRGLIFITPHYGNWEMMSMVIGFKGVGLTLVAEPTKNPALSQVINGLRAQSGHRIIEPKFAVLKLMKALLRGGATAMAADVNGRRRRGGVWCDFFGLQVFNGSGLAELALRTKAAIIPGAGKPLPDGRVQVKLFPPLHAEPTGDHTRDVQKLTETYTKLMEEIIRNDPENWLWTYKRWKRRPTPEQGQYPFYSRFQKV